MSSLPNLTHRPTVADALVGMALDLTASLSSEKRYEQLLSAIVQAIPCDAAALLRFDGEALCPIAVRGIQEAALGRPFLVTEHPRLKAIVSSRHPVLFPDDDPRPDPYDGLVQANTFVDLHVHSCMGAALFVGERLVGALTLDALRPNQFNHVDMQLFEGFAAMTAASLQVAELIELLEQSSKVTQARALDLVSEALRRHGQGLVGRSGPIERVRGEIHLVAGSDLTVLITGETGTGKELVARMVHAQSKRADQPLIYVNCAALPEGLAESELFGHVRGAYTGATGARAGKFELAHHGTLFLDEIGELPVALQAKLLRALQFGEIQRVGSDEHRQVDVRIITATNRDLTQAVKAGRFRADLFHRISVFPIHVPPLRERPEDLGLLGGYLLDRVRSRLGLPPLQLSPAAVSELEAYDWPGNVRELEHELTRAALRTAAQGGTVLQASIFDLGKRSASISAQPSMPPGLPLRQATEAFQRAHIQAAVAASEGNWSSAARKLGMDRGNLHRLAKRLGIK